MAKFLDYGDTGDRVKRLQRGLNDNKYHKLSRKLVVDGEMRTLTCAAVKTTKRSMGYPAGQMDPNVTDQIAGKFFFDLLEGKRELPDAYKSRRKARLADDKKTATPRKKLRLKALSIIKGELGTMERGENHIKYNSWWGWGAVAYCVIGVSWAWVKAGSTSFKKGARWAGTDLMLADAKAGRNGLHITSDPLPGCPGVIDFDGKSDPDHCITFVEDNGDGTCKTYEFNTVKGSVEGVFRKDRPLRNCWWFGVEH
ncbi:MAG: hypothetical protein ABFE13_12035 [Phycisphaerales bacterium]